MNNNLRYVTIDRNFKDIDRVEEIYNYSFPPSERFFTVRQAMEMIKKMPMTIVATAVYDDDMLVGFYVMSQEEEYSFMYYFAVDQTIRNKGYGGDILRKVLKDNENTIFFGHIEKPVPGEENYEIKLRRQRFYERNGMITVYNNRTVDGTEYITVTNKTGEEFERYYKIEKEEEDEIIRSIQ